MKRRSDEASKARGFKSLCSGGTGQEEKRIKIGYPVA
jgi:hypothetical protein